MGMTSLFGDNKWTAVGYRSPESGQVEQVIFYEPSGAEAWYTAYTVPTNKTLYITKITMHRTGSVAAGFRFDGTVIFEQNMTNAGTEEILFTRVPLKLVGGTIIEFKGSGPVEQSTLVVTGWEE